MSRAVATLAFAALWTQAAAADPVSQLRFIGAVELPQGITAGGTRVGGLSGLDYDAPRDRYFAISDDRSDFAPARFYELRLTFAEDRLTAADVLTATPLRQSDGTVFPKGTQADAAKGEVPDPETLRIDPADPSLLWWTSEGDRARGLPPFLRSMDRTGVYRGAPAVPAIFAAHPAVEKGVRNNYGFEALSFAADGASLWLGLESALYEDGPLPTPQMGAVSRFTRLDRGGKSLGQFAYPISPVPGRPAAGKAADNGVTEILARDARHLLVIERAAIQGDDGSYRNDIRLFEASLEGATDVSALPALANANYQPMTKRLIANLGELMASSGVLDRIDNIEGMTWGPKLSNGHRTLVFVSDDNFSKAQVTQFLAFEVLP